MFKRGSNRKVSSPQGQPTETAPSLKYQSSSSRYSFHRQYTTGYGSSSYGISPQYKSDGRTPFSPETAGTIGRENSFNEEEGNLKWKPSENSFDKHRTFHGAKYSLNVGKEVSSIDKINSPESKSLIIAGKSHLGIYRFDEDSKTLNKTHDFLQSGKTGTATIKTATSTLRRATKKISTISDVKAGFHNHKNYVAICGTSTSVSIYDINKTSTIDNPIVTTLSEHTRSINSVDFNMVQTSLIISGGQDGCIKIWDLRSPKISTNRSDISINTGSDSIRDVKWMPSYDFSNDSNGASNRNFKFASVHDSGLLLKFDLRQPSQAEKKINSHSGPALCLNWHPHQEYIISGGRDGKCCLWYVGDKSNQINNNSATNINPTNPTAHTFSASYPLGLSTTLAFPELTISTARPMNKLKFCPKYEGNIFNSLISTSSMGEDSEVSIYSLARKYIPRNVIASSSPSVGFVWWDENTIFNIDKQNTLTGWDISHEPTVLDNLPKNSVKWRDLDGDGILFLDQRTGGYKSQEEMVLTPGSGENRKVPLTHRMSTATANSFVGGGNNHIPSNASSSAASFSKGGGLSLPHLHQNNTFTERPSLSKHNPSISSKFSPSVNSSQWSNSFPSPHHNSVVSASELALHPSNDSFLQSPYLVGLDFPHILNTIRSTRLSELHRKVESPELLDLKSSPTEVFKFLARELKFFYKRKADDTKDNFNETETSSHGSADSKSNLMEKLGLAENNTWTHLIKYTKSHDSDEVVSKGTEPKTPISDKTETIERRIANTQSESKTDEKPVRTQSSNQIKTKNLIELITVCDKNAETYVMLEDFSNYKVWLLMRDALLWDLKVLTESMAVDENGEQAANSHSSFEQPWKKNDSFTSLKDVRQVSVASGYSSYSATDLSSSVNTNTRHSFSEPTNLTQTPPVSHLKAQLQGSKEPTTISRSDSIQNSLRDDILEIRKLHQSCGNKADIAIEEEDENDEAGEREEAEDGVRNKQFIEIPVRESKNSDFATGPSSFSERNELPSTSEGNNQLRRPRTSFIDSFMSQLRSPASTNFDGDRESTGSKRSSMPSLTSSAATMLNMKKPPNNNQNKLKNATEVSSILESEAGPHNSWNGNAKPAAQVSGITALINETKKLENAITPPWSSRRLIQQLYEQSVASGNILLTMAILLLFQDMFQIASTEIVKNSIAEFTALLHRYELFEIAAELLKNSSFEDISNSSSGLSSIQLFCDECNKPLINEPSKEKFTKEKLDKNPGAMSRFGYWYCDSCSKRNTLCCFCSKPMKNLAISMLNCGHEGHFRCLKKWFFEENMDVCPLGCPGILF
ncbi:unnamed protein product [Kluyveromyces dobzhanskii CBS 2104]|uniref:Restriction of telomere capping protein 1 n=1 Tax=Kluyveromyces dobzhanskii CBS 2104 TaxID=1427455 RepID=A0A0A8LA31_9SACH|nr:unnamed protein product [Kluyveromyces dobzhanskii CBS 2104]